MIFLSMFWSINRYFDLNRKLACLIKMTVMQDFFVINYHSWKAWRIYSMELNWPVHALLCSSLFKLFPHLSYRTPHLKEWLGTKNFPSSHWGLHCQTCFPIKKMSSNVWFNDEAEAVSKCQKNQWKEAKNYTNLHI